ncbi:glycosyltransferase [Pontibacter sp. E15-1]|uniref:glycosyltransferase n=1 Tax=Pontibacter sp. E15-1 TaxID=2919918 RepID=UPI001F4F1A11|nr:glycosyltransferase [Pontibacter sp. E15-1]MCJ8166208.1 glycosyltransferase [Pontibacter sp. E15-1]
MSEKRILIASLLKPINDTRMYEKLGVSLSLLPQVQVHLVGFQAPSPPGAPANMRFHPLFRFRRLSLGRVAAQFAYYRLLRQLKPDLIIVCTHELLLANHLYCQRHSCQLVYDVQENYALNLASQDNYAPLLKKALGWGVGMLERRLARHVAHFLVAEQSYVQELPFLGRRHTLLENKYKPAPTYRIPPTPTQVGPDPLRLLYTGTMARLYGVFEAIALADALYQLEPGTSLTLIGYCADSDTLRQIEQLAEDRPYLTLIGGGTLVPHQQIVEAFKTHDVALMPYQPHESTFRCMPTKLYEYAAHALPMVVQQNPLWDAFLKAHQAGIAIDYTAPDSSALLRELRKQQFYEPGVPSGVFWDSEEKKLLTVMRQLLHQ